MIPMTRLCSEKGDFWPKYLLFCICWGACSAGRAAKNQDAGIAEFFLENLGILMIKKPTCVKIGEKKCMKSYKNKILMIIK